MRCVFFWGGGVKEGKAEAQHAGHTVCHTGSILSNPEPSVLCAVKFRTTIFYFFIFIFFYLEIHNKDISLCHLKLKCSELSQRERSLFNHSIVKENIKTSEQTYFMGKEKKKSLWLPHTVLSLITANNALK